MTDPAQHTPPPPADAPLPPGRIVVEHVSGDSFAVAVRGHRMVVDQPVGDGGTDTGPTPTELFAASLVSCVAFYAGRYLARHGVDPQGLRVGAGFTMATDRPARVSGLTVSIEVPDGLDPSRHEALLAVASHCTVHNTLHQPPTVEIGLCRSGTAE
ncbi:OsmC family protein [Kitasatospora sp. RB6PN24]|uniref:OsmC family protein n=1 Tax=Kitasatospora humi TaxID=2893891 RepID=UPI001E340B0A|nr:OsmC family protein [Kitasatospora humi]MCC9310992.1 OsmC family protein [Kitasatospora humi]